ncbi:hypothetical protein SK128_009232 [Halocaridina rubra]|uniref:GST C-terminal domain-containing protein n=1 Tax=Halocaridina rubra TaxID=373956 RepID=A0AAN9ACR1_HALRR
MLITPRILSQKSGETPRWWEPFTRFIMQKQDTLYLLGKKDNGGLFVPAESLVALFVLEYCQNPSVNVVLVEACKQREQLSSHEYDALLVSADSDYTPWFPFDEDCLSFPFVMKILGECPDMVSNCILPVIVLNSQPWCVAGLCSSLRVMLAKTVENHPTHYCKSLLGFRGGCMQACAEVSVWTKFCEVEVINTLKHVYNNCHINEGKVLIPRDIIRFEYHMQCPPVLHNGLKKKQQYLRDTISDKTELKLLLAKKLSELPDMEHEYAEGLDMTMADLMLFVCFHILLCKLKTHIIFEDICPLVMKWYKLLLNNEHIKQSICILQKSLTNDSPIFTDNLEVVLPEVKRESMYNSDPERYKPRWRAFTHQSDIDRVLNLFDEAFLSLDYDPHPLGESITLPWSDFPPAVSPQEGQLPPTRLKRKCEQLDNIISAILSTVCEGDTIVDFCAGGGHVGIILAYLLPSCRILLVENKDHSLLRAKQRIETLQLSNVHFLQCNLDYFQGKFDLGVCLHACGVATDLVMQKCFEQKAKFVCSPCCYGSVRPNHILNYPRSKIYSDIPISLDDYLIIGHTSDQTHDENNPKTEQGQLCMRLIDNDRLLLARSLGYATKMVLMEPRTCSPKNHLLIGVLPD